MSKTYIFTSESVTEGHPDKVSDHISDAILDEFLRQDPDSRVAVETLVTANFVVVSGEVTSKGKFDVEKVVRDTIAEIGYDDDALKFDAKTCEVIVKIHLQSSDISQGVTATTGKEQGAGDQGLMFGYATNETGELMPLPISLAHKLTKKLADVRKSKELTWVRPDGKSQVSVMYVDDKPQRIETVVISIQSDPKISNEEIRKQIIDKVIKPVCGNWWHENIKMYINPTGKFEFGGPAADTGLTGRKIIVDSYGGMGRHGGGAFSGKDPSKVDRSACYMCRYVAKNLVAAGLADRCEIQIAYSIGVCQPLSLMVNTFETNKIPEEKIEKILNSHFDMKPASIVSHLKLKRPIYKKTAGYGHFGRNEPEFTWEKTDKAEDLRKAAGL
ncbi:methionine adenosyltransferase [Marine Group I thaumarchaeote]|uniref:Methionine adenosyltransferase n=1 Tax=Marine Group I thaumarchaeote TaxID=2511932 RepID=A0A7K4NNY3_9ARCH|nr:methionine adenosyltransferase [Marine Group I thaumarchaeote]